MSGFSGIPQFSLTEAFYGSRLFCFTCPKLEACATVEEAVKLIAKKVTENEVSKNLASTVLDQCNKLRAFEAEKKTLESKIQSLETEKTDLIKRLGEAVIDPSAKKISDLISKRVVLALLESIIPSKQIIFSHGQTGGFHRLIDDVKLVKRKIEES
jgi:predicted transcriptional regulator